MKIACQTDLNEILGHGAAKFLIPMRLGEDDEVAWAMNVATTGVLVVAT